MVCPAFSRVAREHRRRVAGAPPAHRREEVLGITVGLTAVAATVSWYAVEAPFLKRKRRFEHLHLNGGEQRRWRGERPPAGASPTASATSLSVAIPNSSRAMRSAASSSRRRARRLTCGAEPPCAVGPAPQAPTKTPMASCASTLPKALSYRCFRPTTSTTSRPKLTPGPATYSAGKHPPKPSTDYSQTRLNHPLLHRPPQSASRSCATNKLTRPRHAGRSLLGSGMRPRRRMSSRHLSMNSSVRCGTSGPIGSRRTAA